jgi:hypothetical protein
VDETSRLAQPDRETPSPTPGPPHLADPRAVQILSTEHWSLLTARSLVYNESFARGSMFLTLLSASLVALGFVYQGGGGGADFPLIVAAVLALDLFVGIATLGRLVMSVSEEFRAMQGMNRIRHAYLEMVPTLQPYFSASPFDDPDSVRGAYGVASGTAGALPNVGHGLTTMPGMIAVLDAALAGGLVAALIVALGGDARVAFIAGVVAVIGAIAVIGAAMYRIFEAGGQFVEPRFPGPDARG